MNAAHAVQVESVAAEWQRRVARYRSWNRVWLAIAVLWLGAVGVAGILGVLGNSVGFLYAGVLFVCGFPALATASLGMNRLLRCPQCGQHQRQRAVESIAACERCSTRLT